jgi:hypothetical protein
LYKIKVENSAYVQAAYIFQIPLILDSIVRFMGGGIEGAGA